jgi:hypothetical protein
VVKLYIFRVVHLAGTNEVQEKNDEEFKTKTMNTYEDEKKEIRRN